MRQDLNLALTQKILAQHEKNLRSFLSILDRMQWAKKPSHATVPLNRVKPSSLNTNGFFCINAGVHPYFTGCVPTGAGLEGIQEAPRSQPQREERNARLRTHIEFKNIMNPYLIPISLISSCLSVVSIGEFSPLLKQIIYQRPNS
jgi:hypothetical protein